MESAARQTGVTPAALIGPGLGDHLIPIWESFGDLTLRRGSAGFGANPISWEALQAWIAVRHRGRVPASWIIEGILSLDDDFMTHQSEQAAKRQKAKGG